MTLETFKTRTLTGVTTATNGAPINSSSYTDMSVWVSVTGNTGAVTVNIEGSESGAFAGEEVSIDAKTYTATNKNEVFTYGAMFDFTRVTTTSATSSTVTAVVSGRQL